MVQRTPLLLHWSPSSRFCLLWIQPFVLPFLERKAQRAGGEHLPGQTICLGIQAREEGEKKRGKEEMKKDLCSLMEGGRNIWGSGREVRSHLCWMVAPIGITASVLWVQKLSCVCAHGPLYSLEWAPETSRQLGGDARPCQAIMSFLCLCQGYAEDKLSSLLAPRNQKQNKNHPTERERNLLVVGL